MYIHAASSITTLDTFGRKGFARELLTKPTELSELCQPEYKKYIPLNLIRRTPKINKMALACMEDCLEQYGQELDAIVVGTGLGCLSDTEKFLGHIANAELDQMLSPTAFIQSGHNAISGQMALIKKNHGYNMTYAQGGLSFEYALSDALLCLREGHENVLVGAADEKIDVLDDLVSKFQLNPAVSQSLTEGGSFFVLDANPSPVKVIDVLFCGADWQGALQGLFGKHSLNWENISYAFIGHNWTEELGTDLACASFEYTKSCGRYLSSSAFGMHLAYDYLLHQKEKYALVINRVDESHTGLTLLERD